MEQCRESLYRRIPKLHEKPDAYARHIAVEIASGMAYLHSCNVLHNDLKSQNVLLGAHAAPNAVKLSDFGKSREKVNRSSISGTGALSFIPHSCFAAR